MALDRNIITIQDLSSLDFTCDASGLRINQWITCQDNGDNTFSLIDSRDSSIICTFPTGGGSGSISAVIPQLDGSYVHSDGNLPTPLTQVIDYSFDESHTAVDGLIDLVNSEGVVVDSFQICSPNCPPVVMVANPDIENVDYCGTIYGYLSTNDDTLQCPLPIYQLIQGSEVNGVAIVGASGEFSFTPTVCATGTPTSFQYRILCDNATPVSALVTINITAPTADAVDDFFAQPSNTPLAGILYTNDTLCSSGETTFKLRTQSINGVATVNEDGTFVFAPNLGFTGTTTFEYSIYCNDIFVDFATATIFVIQATPNDDFTTAFTATTMAAFDASANDSITCPAPGVITYGWIGGPQPFANGTISGGATPDNFQYTSDPGFSGIDYAQYEIFCDPDGGGPTPPISLGTATIFMTVTRAFALDDSFAGQADTPFSGNVTLNDIPCGGGSTVTYHLVSDPLADGGGLSEPTNKCINPGNEPQVTVTSWNQATGDFTITPTGGWVGSACFDYFVRCTYNGVEYNSPPATVQFSAAIPSATISSACAI